MKTNINFRRKVLNANITGEKFASLKFEIVMMIILIQEAKILLLPPKCEIFFVTL